MERTVENQLLGITVKQVQDNILPKKIKPKRQSLKDAQKQVEGSVRRRGKVPKNISKEQGFRNYVKYTDPLLLNNNEIDQGDIANSIANILNVFHPNKMGTEKMQEVQKFMVKEKPVDVNDIKTEIPVGKPIETGLRTVPVYDGVKIEQGLRAYPVVVNEGLAVQQYPITTDEIKKAKQILKNIPKSSNVKKIEESIMKEKQKTELKNKSASILQSAIKRIPAQKDYSKETGERIEASKILSSVVKRATAKIPKVVQDEKNRKEAKAILDNLGKIKRMKISQSAPDVEISSKPPLAGTVKFVNSNGELIVPRTNKDGTLDNRFFNSSKKKK